jgi:hypothetical protein
MNPTANDERSKLEIFVQNENVKQAMRADAARVRKIQIHVVGVASKEDASELVRNLIRPEHHRHFKCTVPSEIEEAISFESTVCCFADPDGNNAWYGTCSEDSPICIQVGQGCPA